MAAAPGGPLEQLGDRPGAALEDESVVTSEWSAELPGPAKRTYTLTDSGRRLLDQWAEALRETESVVAAFLERYEGERR